MKRLLLLGCLLSCVLYAQSTDAVLTGTVLDQSGAIIAGASVTVTNVKTGVTIPTTSNSSGVYSFPSVQPGVYRVTAERQGFKKYVLNEVNLNIGDKLSINLPLEVGAVADAVEVTAGSESALGYATASVGGVLTQKRILELPMASRNVLALVDTQAGVFGNNVNGVQRVGLNIALDGINVQDNRINVGVSTTLFPSVDRIDDVQIITSPADAEFGRGSAQILLTSRSGTNRFGGSLFHQHRNTVLTANDWFDNRAGNPRDVLLEDQFGGRVGGPIIPNKTFFHVHMEGFRQRSNNTVTRTVYTQQARQGMYRFFPGVQNQNANAVTPTVDEQGNPVRPAAATGDLQTVSLFGRDPNRLTADPSGIMQKALELMPLPNYFRTGDGLNTAGFQFKESARFSRSQINFRIDQNFNAFNRLSVTYNWENEDEPNSFVAAPFPGLPGGDTIARTRVLSAQLTTQITTTLFNEFVGGFQRPLLRFRAPWEEGLFGTSYLPTIGSQPFLPDLGTVTDPYSLGNDPQGRISPVYSYKDTIRWLKGHHGIKAGFEVKFVSTNGFNSFDVMPRVNVGAASNQPVQNISNIPSIGQNVTLAQTLLSTLSGTVSGVDQALNSPGGSNPIFLPGEFKQRTWRAPEYAWFIQDDYKVTSNLTLNLGLRYDYYSPPYDVNGKAAAMVGGTAGIFGISGTGFDALFQPGLNRGSLSLVELVGKGSPNPGRGLYNPDRNNFGPVVGLAWSLPQMGWLTGRATVLRAGYGWAYERHSLRITDVVASDLPGLRDAIAFTSPDLLNMRNVSLPLTSPRKPLELIPFTDRGVSAPYRQFDTGMRSPYVQNWSFGIQRDLAPRTTLDVKWVGSKGTRLILGADVNEDNIFETGILEAFRVTQAGGDHSLLDQLFLGANISGVGRVDGVTVRGSRYARSNSTIAGWLASNNVGAFANFLNTSTLATTSAITNQRGGIPRRAGFPENWITVNPQVASSRLTSNYASSIYHSLQIELRSNVSKHLTILSSYVFSKTFGIEDGDDQEQIDNFLTLRNFSLDRLQLFAPPHVIRNSGLWELPVGPGRAVMGGSRGVLARLVGGWQLGYVFDAASGGPTSFSVAGSTFNEVGGATGVALAPIPRHVANAVRTGVGPVGMQGYTVVNDPVRDTFEATVRDRTTLRALQDPSGRLLVVNPALGTLGGLGRQPIYGFGSFGFDMNLIKRIRINERFSFELRIDAEDVLNHPIWGNPNFDINSTNFGNITSSAGERLVVIGGRIYF